MSDSNPLNNLSDNLGLIYEASLNPEMWPYALEALCNEFGASKAQLLYIHPEELTFSFACGFGFDPYAHNIGAARFRRYLLQDPVALYALENTNEVFSDRRVIDPNVLHRSPMQTDIRDPADMEYLLTIYTTEDKIDGTVLILFRGKDQFAFDEGDEYKLTRYLTHLKRATRIHKALAGSQQLETLQSSLLNHLQWGVVVVDEERKILLCNDAGKNVIEKNNSLLIRNNRLVCISKNEQDLLSKSISKVLEGRYGYEDAKRISLKISSHQRGQIIFMMITPLTMQRFEVKQENLLISQSHYITTLPNRRYALISFCDSNRYENWSEMLKELFGLTPAEAALANKLADDCSLTEAAKLLGRSVGTARIQLQSIFEKTGTNRQSSLVRMLMSIPP